MKISSYPKTWNLGHPSVDPLFNEPVVVQEKVDGSQLSAKVEDGEIFFRSKGSEKFYPNNDNLFKSSMETLHSAFERGVLNEGYTYRGESIWRPRHNTLEYDRAPKGNFVLFDVDTGNQRYLDPEKLDGIAEDIGCEATPILYRGEVDSEDQLRDLLDTESFLGGPKIEGIVIKNYERFDEKTGKVLMGKLVSQDFREKHTKSWKARQNKSPVQKIIDSLATEARWKKAIQHRRDEGELLMAPQDIGPLMKEIHKDIEEEEKEWIKEKLWEAHRKDILKGVSGQFPYWYKEWLALKQFDGKEE